MRKRRIKKFVLPTLFVVIGVSLFLSAAVLNSILLSDELNYDYSKSLMKDATQAVLSEQKEDKTKQEIYKPYVSENVEVLVSYYDKDASEEEKEKSLIVYENTYMPSTGIVYASDEEFDVIAVMDGKVTNIKNDDILGTMIEITHDTNLITYYYSLKDVKVNIGTSLNAGTILGKATTNNIYGQKNNFLFEVYYQGKSLNPESFYKMNELQ
jgi:stage II sporulation protein Q